MNTLALRILFRRPRLGTTIAEGEAAVPAGGFVLGGLAEGVCSDALEIPCTLALHTQGRLATDEEVALVRSGLVDIRDHSRDGADVREAIGLLAQIDAFLSVRAETHNVVEMDRYRRRVPKLVWERSPS